MTTTIEFSATFIRHRARLKKAKDDFDAAVGDPLVETELGEIRKLFNEVIKAVRHADTCIGELEPAERRHTHPVRSRRGNHRILAERSRRCR
jgi:hypothetical protein